MRVLRVKQFLKLIPLGALMAVTTPCLASLKPLKCETNFGEKSFTIDQETIAFHQQTRSGRSISSVLSTGTTVTTKGFKKVIYKDGSKHLISIKDMNQLSSNNDFLAITSPKGHKMTFPINCYSLE